MDDHSEGLPLVIWVVAGTRDARSLIEQLRTENIALIASVVSDYGEQILRDQFDAGIITHKGALDITSMRAFVRQHEIQAIIDATHPYARFVSENLMTLSYDKNIPYLRYERPKSRLPEHEALFMAADWLHCLEILMEASRGETVFLATGSRLLSQAVPNLLQKGLKPFVRILPDPVQISYCLDLGLTPGQIIAMQGPFSYELNRAMLAQTRSDWLITKESGSIGGAGEKIQAALDLGLKVIVLDRPSIAYPKVSMEFQEIVDWAKMQQPESSVKKNYKE